MMGILNVIIGLISIGAGLLVKRYPNLISGYGMMPDERKKNIDIAGLSLFMRNGLIIIGILIIACYYLLKIAGLNMPAELAMPVIIFGGTVVMVTKMQKYDRNKDKNNKTAYIILVGLFLLITGLLFYGLIPTKTVVEGNTVRFTGEYGISLEISEIKKLELVDTIPPIRIRVNGLSLGPIHKGTFRMEKWGKCSLLINSGTPPYLVITRKNGGIIIVNHKEPSETKNSCRTIKMLMD